MTPELASAELCRIAATVRERDPMDAVHRFLEKVSVRDNTAELQGALLIAGCLSYLANDRLQARPEDLAIALRALNPES